MAETKQEQEIQEIQEEATDEAVANFVEDSNILDFYNYGIESFISSL